MSIHDLIDSLLALDETSNDDFEWGYEGDSPARLAQASSSATGAPANEAVTGRAVSAYSWLQPSRTFSASRSRQPSASESASARRSGIACDIVSAAALPDMPAMGS